MRHDCTNVQKESIMFAHLKLLLVAVHDDFLLISKVAPGHTQTFCFKSSFAAYAEQRLHAFKLWACGLCISDLKLILITRGLFTVWLQTTITRLCCCSLLPRHGSCSQDHLQAVCSLGINQKCAFCIKSQPLLANLISFNN